MVYSLPLIEESIFLPFSFFLLHIIFFMNDIILTGEDSLLCYLICVDVLTGTLQQVIQMLLFFTMIISQNGLYKLSECSDFKY